MLENNNYLFNVLYKQIIGTAMGTIFAPTYAALTRDILSFTFMIFAKLNGDVKLKSFL